MEEGFAEAPVARRELRRIDAFLTSLLIGFIQSPFSPDVFSDALPETKKERGFLV